MMMEHWKAFKKPFDDVYKLAVGVALSSIPIVRWVSKGYMLENSGIGAEKPSDEMPGWEDWRTLWVKGFHAALIMIAYNLPAIIVGIVGVSIASAGLMSAYSAILTPDIMEEMRSGMLDLKTITELTVSNAEAIMPHLYRLMPAVAIALLLKIVASILTPIATLQYLESGRMSDAFKLRRILRVAASLDYVIAWLTVQAYTIAAGIMFAMIPLVGYGTAYFITGIYAYTLYGQVYRNQSSETVM